MKARSTTPRVSNDSEKLEFTEAIPSAAYSGFPKLLLSG